MIGIMIFTILITIKLNNLNFCILYYYTYIITKFCQLLVVTIFYLINFWTNYNFFKNLKIMINLQKLDISFYNNFHIIIDGLPYELSFIHNDFFLTYCIY